MTSKGNISSFKWMSEVSRDDEYSSAVTEITIQVVTFHPSKLSKKTITAALQELGFAVQLEGVYDRYAAWLPNAGEHETYGFRTYLSIRLRDQKDAENALILKKRLKALANERAE